jgi:hypothetical protein
MDAGVQQVVDRELALLDPAVRADADRVRSLLHADFVEYGVSGRVWDRAAITSATSGSPDPITAAGMRARRLGPDAVLLTYRSESSGRRALRSSTWIRDPRAGWVLLFHQGTACG